MGCAPIATQIKLPLPHIQLPRSWGSVRPLHRTTSCPQRGGKWAHTFSCALGEGASPTVTLHFGCGCPGAEHILPSSTTGWHSPALWPTWVERPTHLPPRRFTWLPPGPSLSPQDLGCEGRRRSRSSLPLDITLVPMAPQQGIHKSPLICCWSAILWKLDPTCALLAAGNAPLGLRRPSASAVQHIQEFHHQCHEALCCQCHQPPVTKIYLVIPGHIPVWPHMALHRPDAKMRVWVILPR